MQQVHFPSSDKLERKDADLVPLLVFAVTELRNAVAHKGGVFDTRFASAKVRRKWVVFSAANWASSPRCPLDFRTITDYLALVVYLCTSPLFAKRDVYQATSAFAALSDELRSQVHRRVFDQIVHSCNRGKVRRIEAWIRARRLGSASRVYSDRIAVHPRGGNLRRPDASGRFLYWALAGWCRNVGTRFPKPDAKQLPTRSRGFLLLCRASLVEIWGGATWATLSPLRWRRSSSMAELRR